MRLQVERTTASQPVPSAAASSRASRPRRREVDRDPLAQRERRLVVRDSREGELHAREVGHGKDDGDEPEPEQHGPGVPSPSESGLSAQHERHGVEDPDRDGHGHGRVVVAALELRQAGHDPDREKREPDDDHARGEPVERLERGQPKPKEPGVPALEPALLEEVDERRAGRDREACEPRQDQPGVRREHPSALLDVVDTGPAADPRQREETDCDRHHGEADQAIARPAPPDQIAGDDEPGEEVQCACPRPPREPVHRECLRDEEARLREPADPDAPDPEAAVTPGPRSSPAYANAASP